MHRVRKHDVVCLEVVMRESTLRSEVRSVYRFSMNTLLLRLIELIV